MKSNGAYIQEKLIRERDVFNVLHEIIITPSQSHSSGMDGWIVVSGSEEDGNGEQVIASFHKCLTQNTLSLV